MSESNAKLSRREFLGATTFGAAALMLGPSTGPDLGAAWRANDRVNVGVIGAGGQGSSLIRSPATVPDSKITGMFDIFGPNPDKGVNPAGDPARDLSLNKKM